MKKILFAFLLLLAGEFVFSQSSGIYLKISDAAFKKEVTGGSFDGFLNAESVSFGVATAVAPPTGGGGQTAGKPSFSDVSFMHQGNFNSPTFNLFTATGKHIQSVDINFVKLNSGGTPEITYIVKLENVTFTSVSTSSNDCSTCSFGIENITMSYAKITWTDKATNTVHSYDIATAKGL